jgi:hypothetical protein
MDLQRKLESGYSKLSSIGEGNLARKKKEDSISVYKGILKIREDQRKEEEKEQAEKGNLSPKTIDKNKKKSSIFFTEL